MLIQEAKWFGQNIYSLDYNNIFPMLNVGSSTATFREIEQPYIDKYIFKPAREGMQKVCHFDIKDAPGVDIVGDLSDSKFLQKLNIQKFNSVFCSNLLEHVVNRKETCRIISSIIPVGGFVFVSCPYKYPWHADPIDTMFRPNVDELAACFSNTDIICGEVITGPTYFDCITCNLQILTKAIIRIFMPFYRPRGWVTAVHKIPWLFRNYQITLLVLQKKSE